MTIWQVSSEGLIPFHSGLCQREAGLVCRFCSRRGSGPAVNDCGTHGESAFLFIFDSLVPHHLEATTPARQLPKRDASADRWIEGPSAPLRFPIQERRQRLRDRF